jgi:hypothetical protein
MHFCKATIALGEDVRNVVVRDQFSPISWPEMEIIRATHGDASVTEIIPFVSVRQTPRAERQRLALIYGDDACSDAWGGRTGPSEMEAPAATLRAGVEWLNPITGQMEITEGKSHGVGPDVIPAADPDEAETELFGDTPKVPLKKRA